MKIKFKQKQFSEAVTEKMFKEMLKEKRVAVELNLKYKLKNKYNERCN